MSEIYKEGGGCLSEIMIETIFKINNKNIKTTIKIETVGS